VPWTLSRVSAALARAGFPDHRAEARTLLGAAAGDGDLLAEWLARRVEGEPLAWLTGTVTFAGCSVHVDRGVFVPRPQTELVVGRAIERLPDGGLAADLATGSGAVAVALSAARPRARVLATDVDAAACRCARTNGVEVHRGHLGRPLPGDLRGFFDVVVAIVPYVPTEALDYLPRDVRRHEPLLALDGGPGGLQLLEEAVRSAAMLLRPGGALLLEVGGEQDARLASPLAAAGFAATQRLVDGDGDLRGLEATYAPRAAAVDGARRPRRAAAGGVRPLAAGDVGEIAAWHYPEPYDVYDLSADPEDLAEFRDVARSEPDSHVGVHDGDGGLVGFVTFARRAGGVVELGLGMRPDLTGRGDGEAFVLRAVRFANARFRPARLTLAVAAFNERAMVVYRRAGFVETARFVHETNGGRHLFVRMTRPATDP
jgi:release factor glutamine methyltransferase